MSCSIIDFLYLKEK